MKPEERYLKFRRRNGTKYYVPVLHQQWPKPNRMSRSKKFDRARDAVAYSLAHEARYDRLKIELGPTGDRGPEPEPVIGLRSRIKRGFDSLRLHKGGG